jgi:regulator of protease activity HflC (stomatin/prohibitin superfamily)
MEVAIKEQIQKTLADEKLDGSITITQVLVRNVVPADSVVDSANALVRAKNEFKQKEVEVQTAKKEAERMQALANQGSQSISYMQAQAQLMIAEGIKNGKVNTVVVPHDFKGQVVVK